MKKDSILKDWKKIVPIIMAIQLIVVLVVMKIFGDKVANVAAAGNGHMGMMVLFSIIMVILMEAVTVGVVMLMKRDEEASNAKSDKYKKLFLNLPIGFAQAQILVDPATKQNMGYKITDANERFGHYFKLDSSDYINKNLSETKIDVLQDIRAWFDAYSNSGTREGELLTVEITMENLNKVFSTVMYKTEKDFVNMAVIDITEQKETEKQLSKAIKDANAAYKTQAEFLANMSHEIRTPINGILGMLQLTLMADDLQADYRDNLDTAKSCADTLLRLINDILDISKLEAGKYVLKEEAVDIKTAIEEAVALQVPVARNKGLTLDCSFGGAIPKSVKADGPRMQQILNCLLSNAIKFTSEGGVRVKVQAIDGENEDIKLRIAVADSGIGIAEKDMGKLFIRFSQVDASDTRKYGGSGLGLVITKQIVELMGGNISVQSKENIGSTFIVEVPMRVLKAAEENLDEEITVTDNPATFSIDAHSRARILVAEDEPVNQQVIGKLLGMAGYSYDIAENGEKAVELFKKKFYDAALFDIQMPVMDGLTATQEIRKIEMRDGRKRMPIIAVTARAMFGDKERILQAKLDDYIAKPYNLNDVVETLRKYVGE